jgi:hypothetical protein
VPKPLKIVIWVAVFAVCAGVGAFVASRSNPFPPGVEDPGAHFTPTPTPTQPVPTSWTLTMRVNTQHTLHEGGACRSDWTTTGTIEIQPNGKAAGAADAKLASPASCDFAQSQIQAKAIRLNVTGSRAAGVLRLSFSEAGRLLRPRRLHQHPSVHASGGEAPRRRAEGAHRHEGHPLRRRPRVVQLDLGVTRRVAVIRS